jgi:hypothetical protein
VLCARGNVRVGMCGGVSNSAASTPILSRFSPSVPGRTPNAVCCAWVGAWICLTENDGEWGVIGVCGGWDGEARHSWGLVVVRILKLDDTAPARGGSDGFGFLTCALVLVLLSPCPHASHKLPLLGTVTIQKKKKISGF